MPSCSSSSSSFSHRMDYLLSPDRNLPYETLHWVSRRRKVIPALAIIRSRVCFQEAAHTASCWLPILQVSLFLLFFFSQNESIWSKKETKFKSIVPPVAGEFPPSPRSTADSETARPATTPRPATAAGSKMTATMREGITTPVSRQTGMVNHSGLSTRWSPGGKSLAISKAFGIVSWWLLTVVTMLSKRIARDSKPASSFVLASVCTKSSQLGLGVLYSHVESDWRQAHILSCLCKWISIRIFYSIELSHSIKLIPQLLVVYEPSRQGLYR